MSARDLFADDFRCATPPGRTQLDMTSIRRATDRDVAQIPVTLARAFAQDPWIQWTVAADNRHHRLVQLFNLFVVNFGRSLDSVWVSDDCAVVASWLPPGCAGPDQPFIDRFGGQIAELMGERARAASDAHKMQDARRPAEPHWYLASMGTHPDWQGKGLGGKVLEPVLARCDADGLPAYTDTATELNVQFYQRQGFEVVDEAQIDGGPLTRLLRRQPGQL